MSRGELRSSSAPFSSHPRPSCPSCPPEPRLFTHRRDTLPRTLQESTSVYPDERARRTLSAHASWQVDIERDLEALVGGLVSEREGS